ncbi:MAG: hypothetical protein GX882_07635 [Methanomicrobiales archaeon]|nr:hypothetical protein [Methanomicrobiales archaeon]
MYGTNGAFGIEFIDPALPGGIMAAFPHGASLDEPGRVQVDSNTSMTGGVAPVVRVPLDRDAPARAMTGAVVILVPAVRYARGAGRPHIFLSGRSILVTWIIGSLAG